MIDLASMTLAKRSAPNLSIFTYATFLERMQLIDYHYCQIIVIIQIFEPLGLCRCQKYHILSLKREKNTFNNYLRVKMTSNHINMDINGFFGPKNIGKSLLLGDLENILKSKMAAAAILKMAVS